MGLVRNDDLLADLMDRCTGGLRVLRLQLGDDGDDDGDDAGGSDLDLESLELHHRVYTQLGRLTYLRELFPGIRYNTNYRDYTDTGRDADIMQFDCLAMSLQSGLGLLCRLKELCEVGMGYMYVVFDQEERLWAAKHWPNAYIDFGEGLEPLLTTEISTLIPFTDSTIHHGLFCGLIQQ